MRAPGYPDRMAIFGTPSGAMGCGARTDPSEGANVADVAEVELLEAQLQSAIEVERAQGQTALSPALCQATRNPDPLTTLKLPPLLGSAVTGRGPATGRPCAFA